MKLIASIALLCTTYAKAPHKKEDLDQMDDHQRHDFDKNIMLDTTDDEWDPYDLDDDEIKNRLTSVLHKIDLDQDGQLSKNELVKHIHKALYAMDEEEAEDEFIDADIDGDDKVLWNEYVSEFYGLEPEDQNNILAMDTDTGTEFNKMYSRDRARFHAADRDSDGALTLIEYVSFKNPLKSEDLRESVIAWALQDVDSDGDGRVSLVEFMADYMTKPTDGLEFYGEDHIDQEKDKFNEDFDINGDGYLEGEELSLWLGPDNTEIAIEEADHLIEMCDENNDSFLQFDEVLANNDVWLDSDATEYGQQLKYIHTEL